MTVVVEVSYWRNPSTGDIYEQAVYDDGTVVNEAPADAEAANITEYYQALAAGESSLSSYLSVGQRTAESAAATRQHAITQLTGTVGLSEGEAADFIDGAFQSAPL